MVRKILFFLLVMTVLSIFGACGGENKSIPSSAILDPPDVMFFNSASSSIPTRIRISGTAHDGIAIAKVMVSLNHGADWHTAVLAKSGSAVDWQFDVTSGMIPATLFTLVSRATNSGGKDEPLGPGHSVRRERSGSPQDLRNLVAAASSGEVIYLSSGSGGAYGPTVLLKNPAPVVLVGMNSGVAGTAPLTVLETASSSSRLLSPGADLVLRNIRVRKGSAGLQLAAQAGKTLWATVEDCWFESQGSWCIRAEGRSAASDSVFLYVTGSRLNADHSNPTGGGILLRKMPYYLFDSRVENAVPGNEVSGGVYIDSPGSVAVVDSCFFADNAIAIKASSGSPWFLSCTVRKISRDPTNGILLKGSGGSPLLRRNVIFNNTGYGVAVSGGSTPVFFRNRIRSNRNAGVLIRGQFPGTVTPFLGNQTQPTTTGYNSLTGNERGVTPMEVFIESGSGPSSSLLLGENNWWGIADAGAIGQKIWDHPEDTNLPTLDFTPFLLSDPNPIP